MDDDELERELFRSSMSNGHGGWSLDDELGGGGHGDELASTLDDELAARDTPSRRSTGANSAEKQANRQSLAFELATASHGFGGHSDLLAELGIEEGDEDEGDDLSYGSEEEDNFAVEAHESGFASAGTRTPTAASSSRHPSARMSPATTLASAETRTLASSVSSSPGDRFLDRLQGSEEDHAQFELTTEALERSIQMTDLLQKRLRQHTSGDQPQPLASGVVEDARFADRQPKVEALASSVVKSMYSMAKEREAQYRELRELDRTLAKHEREWRDILPELEDLPPVEFASPARIRVDRRQSNYSEISSSSSDNGLDARRESYDSNGPLSPLEGPDPFGEDRESSPSPQDPLGEMRLLRQATKTLVTTLSSIHEQSQVSGVAVTDAGRKIRAVRNTLTTWKEDLEGLATSEAFVSRYERDNANAAKGRAATVANECAREARRMLEEDGLRIRELLVPIGTAS